MGDASCQLAVDGGGVVLARWLVIEVEGTAYHIKHEPMTMTLSIMGTVTMTGVITIWTTWHVC